MSAILTNEIARPRAERGPHTIAFRVFDVDGEPCTQGHDVCVADIHLLHVPIIFPRIFTLYNLRCDVRKGDA